MRIAVSHVSSVLTLSETCPSMHGLRATASLHISQVLKYPRTNSKEVALYALPLHTFLGPVKYILVCGTPA